MQVEAPASLQLLRDGVPRNMLCTHTQVLIEYDCVCRVVGRQAGMQATLQVSPSRGM